MRKVGSRSCKDLNRGAWKRFLWSSRKLAPTWNYWTPVSVRLVWSGCAAPAAAHIWRCAKRRVAAAFRAPDDWCGPRWTRPHLKATAGASICPIG